MIITCIARIGEMTSFVFSLLLCFGNWSSEHLGFHLRIRDRAGIAGLS
jgi:hypothetical protein